MTEEKESIEVSDESGDRKYFTIVPNYVLNHSTATAQALYLQLKRLAGESGLAYPSRDYLMERLHIHHSTLKKEFKYLMERGWIKAVGDQIVTTPGGPQKMKAYKIVDIWKLNIENYEGGTYKTTPRRKGGSNETTKGGQTRPPKKNAEKKNKELVSPSAPQAFSLKETLEKWEKDGDRKFDILSWYIKKKNLKPINKEQLQNIVSMNIKWAKGLESYQDDQIVDAANRAIKITEEWNLHSVLKLIR